MAPARWITSNWSDTDAKDEDHYPPLLYAAMQECGYMKRAMYRFRTHKNNGEMTVCEIKVLMPGCERHPQMEPWTVHVTGSEFSDTVQMAAYQALCELVERREKEIGQTSIKYVPTLNLSRPLYKGRMEALEGSSQVEDGPTVVLARYAKAASNLLQLSDNKEQLLRQQLPDEEAKSYSLLRDLESATVRNVLLKLQLERAEASEWALKNSVDQLKESVTALNAQVTELTTQHAAALAHAQQADETQREALAWFSDQLTRIRAHCNRYHMTARQWETVERHVGELNVRCSPHYPQQSRVPALSLPTTASPPPWSSGLFHNRDVVHPTAYGMKARRPMPAVLLATVSFISMKLSFSILS